VGDENECDEIMQHDYVRKDGSAVTTLRFPDGGVVSRDGRASWKVKWGDGGDVTAERPEQVLYTGIAEGRGALRPKERIVRKNMKV